jgi:hypothetical protein
MAEIADAVPPLLETFLLTACQEADAIAQIGPFGLDVCSGVQVNGRLDADKLTALFRQIDRFNATV